MAEIPEPMNTIQAAIDAAHEAREREHESRGYLGASALGNPDTRGLWLGFRQVFRQQFPGRVLRLFRRGHLEESSVVEDLKSIGCDIRNTGDNQKSIDFGCFVLGHSDGIIESGLPGAEKTRHLLEIKTASAKKFAEMCKNGLEQANPIYWLQVHCYMLGLGLDRALFYMVNKNDDCIYTERVKLDKALAERCIKRGHEITLSERMPEPMTTDPTAWNIKFNPYFAAYFPDVATADDWSRLAVQRESTNPLLARIICNRRNDARSTPRVDGTWWTDRYQCEIPREHLNDYDESHILHPDVMELAGWQWVPDQSEDDVIAYRLPSGEIVRNGTPADGVFSSHELLANHEFCASLKDDALGSSIRNELGARISGPGEPK